MLRPGTIAIRQSFYDGLSVVRQDWVRFSFNAVLHLQPLGVGLLWTHPTSGRAYYVISHSTFDPERIAFLAALLSNHLVVFNRMRNSGAVPAVPNRDAHERPEAQAELTEALESPTKLGTDYVEPPEEEEFNWQEHVLDKQPTPGDVMLMFASMGEMLTTGWTKVNP